MAKRVCDKIWRMCYSTAIVYNVTSRGLVALGAHVVQAAPSFALACEHLAHDELRVRLRRAQVLDVAVGQWVVEDESKRLVSSGIGVESGQEVREVVFGAALARVAHSERILGQLVADGREQPFDRRKLAAVRRVLALREVRLLVG